MDLFNIGYDAPEGAALLLAFYFSKPCFREVLKHEDSQSEVTSLEVRYRIAEGTVEVEREHTDEELFGECHEGWVVTQL